MEVADTFIPTAGAVGLLPMVTYFFLVVAMFAFMGNFIFALLTRPDIKREHRPSHLLTAIIAAVAGLSYYVLQQHYHAMLSELATVTDAKDRQTLIRESYNAVGQYRYMDWAVTTPLLLIHMVSLLNLKPDVIRRPLVTMLIADFFMILTGYIGEQQLSFDNEIQVVPRLIWGAISTVGYVLIPLTLYRLWKEFGNQVQPKIRQAYRLMALSTVTFWGVYPIGYILTTLSIDPSWIHIAFTISDLINKIGVGLVAYFATRKLVKPEHPAYR